MEAPSTRSYAIEGALRTWFYVLPSACLQTAESLVHALVLHYYFRTSDTERLFVGLTCVLLSMLIIQIQACSNISKLLGSRVDEKFVDAFWQEIGVLVAYSILAPFHVHTFWAGQRKAGAEAEMASMRADLAFSQKRFSWLSTAANRKWASDRYDVVHQQTTEERRNVATDRWYLLYERIEYRVKKHILETRIQHLQRVHSYSGQLSSDILEDRVEHVKSRLQNYQLHEAANVQKTLRVLRETHQSAKALLQQATIERRKAIQEATLHDIARTSPRFVKLQKRSKAMSGAITWSKWMQCSFQSLPLAVLAAAKLYSGQSEMEPQELDLLLSSLVLSCIHMTHACFEQLCATKVKTTSRAVKPCHPSFFLALVVNISWTLIAVGMCYGTPALGAASYILPAIYLLHGPTLAGLNLLISSVRKHVTPGSDEASLVGGPNLKQDTCESHIVLSSPFWRTCAGAMASSVTDVPVLMSEKQRFLFAGGNQHSISLAMAVFRRLFLLSMAVVSLFAGFSWASVALVAATCSLDATAGMYLECPHKFARGAAQDEAKQAEGAAAALPEETAEWRSREEEASLAHPGVELSAAPPSTSFLHSAPLQPAGRAGAVLEIAAEGLNELMSHRHQWARGTHHHHHHHHPAHVLGHGAARAAAPKRRKARSPPRKARYVAAEYTPHLLGGAPSRSVQPPAPPPAGSFTDPPRSLPQQLLSLCSAPPPEPPGAGWRRAPLPPLPRPQRSGAAVAREARRLVQRERELQESAGAREALRRHCLRALARAPHMPPGSEPPPALLAALRELSAAAAALGAQPLPAAHLAALRLALARYVPGSGCGAEAAAGDAEQRLLAAVAWEESRGAGAEVEVDDAPGNGAAGQRGAGLRDLARGRAWETVETVFGQRSALAEAGGGEGAGFEVVRCEVVVSHCWEEGRREARRKGAALLEGLWGGAAAGCAVLAVSLSGVMAAVSMALAAEAGAQGAWGAWGAVAAGPLVGAGLGLLWALGSRAELVPPGWAPWAWYTAPLWVDPHSLPLTSQQQGPQRVAAFRAAVGNADSVLALASTRYMQSLTCVFELALAAKIAEHKLRIVSLEWPTVLLPLQDTQLSPLEQSWFSSFTCGDAHCFAPSDRVAVLAAIRVEWGAEDAFECYVRDGLPAVLQRSKLQHAGAVRTAFREALSIVGGGS